jgi:hypothetical protein
LTESGGRTPNTRAVPESTRNDRLLASIRRARLAEACARLDPNEERALAEEGTRGISLYAY